MEPMCVWNEASSQEGASNMCAMSEEGEREWKEIE